MTAITRAYTNEQQKATNIAE